MVDRYDVYDYVNGITGPSRESYAGYICSCDGELVKYEDYAALQAENERMKAERVDLEQFRDAVESWRFHAETDMIVGYRTPNPEFIDDAKDRHLEAGHLLALIDGQAKQPAPPSTPVRVSWAEFWMAQGDWPTANDYAAFEKAEQWLLAQQQESAMDKPLPEAVVEAVARAICVACEESPDHQGDARGNESRWQDYRDTALAAISALAAAKQGGLADVWR